MDFFVRILGTETNMPDYSRILFFLCLDGFCRFFVKGYLAKDHLVSIQRSSDC